MNKFANQDEVVSASHTAPTLSGSDRRTLDAVFSHPLSHSLEWSDVVALVGTLGEVEQKANRQFLLRIGSSRQLMHEPRAKDLTAADVIELRHFFRRAGQSPQSAKPAEYPAASEATLMIVVDHHEAKIYRIDVTLDDASGTAIRPYDPHHFLHHLTHKDQSRERGQRAPEDATFYDRIAEAVAAAGGIIIVGHGEGKSNAAHHLTEYLHAHHSETYRRIVREVAVDLSSITMPQLLALGRQALQ